MMESSRQGVAPAGWAGVLGRSLKVAVVAFVVLQLKEWFDAGAFDTPATAVDAALIGGAMLVLDTIFKLLKPRRGAPSPAGTA
jgi:hypothetical protein